MYATADDMRARYGEDILVQLTNAPAWDATAIAAINVKLSDASIRADGYVSKFYGKASGVPVPPMLTLLVCEIAFADLHRVPTEEADKRRGRAIADLVNISKGLLKIDEGDTASLPARDGAVLVPDAERTFSRDRLTGF